MPDAPNRIEGLVPADPNAGRFHIGNMPQAGIPPDLTDEEVASLEAHQATIKVPKGQVPAEEPPAEPPAEPEARAHSASSGQARAAPEKAPEKPASR